MVTKYSIVHLVGMHNRIRPTPQLDRILHIAAKDIARISVNSLHHRAVIVKSITALNAEMKKKQNTIIVYPMISSVVRNDSCLLPTYNMPPYDTVSYRNLYFAVPALGYERLLITNDLRHDILLEYAKIPTMIEYPIAGTDMQKENLLREFLC